jgi:hypothetical protein
LLLVECSLTTKGGTRVCLMEGNSGSLGRAGFIPGISLLGMTRGDANGGL